MTLTITNLRDVRPLQPASAIVETMVCGTACELADIVYDDSDGKVRPAIANVAVSSRVRGIIVASAGTIQQVAKTSYAAGESVSVLRWGLVGGITGMDLTLGVFLSAETAGEMTQTEPSGATTWTHYIGYPLKDTVTGETYLFFAPAMVEPTSNS